MKEQFSAVVSASVTPLVKAMYRRIPNEEFSTEADKIRCLVEYAYQEQHGKKAFKRMVQELNTAKQNGELSPLLANINTVDDKVSKHYSETITVNVHPKVALMFNELGGDCVTDKMHDIVGEYHRLIFGNKGHRGFSEGYDAAQRDLKRAETAPVLIQG